MEKMVNDNKYKIVTILITILLYLLLKDVPYIDVFLTYQVILVVIAIEIAILFRLRAESVLRISLVLYFCTMLAAVLGLAIVDTLATGAFFILIYGWCQSLVGLIRNRKH